MKQHLATLFAVLLTAVLCLAPTLALANAPAAAPQQSQRGMGMFDMLLMGLAVYLLFRFIARRRGGGGGHGRPDERFGNNSHGGLDDDHERDGTYGRDARYRAAEQAWEALKGPTARQSGPEAEAQEADVAPNVRLPQDFDAAEFMKGAKLVFARLQESWSRREIEDLTPFTTPKMLAEIEREAAANPTPSPVDVLVINARLMEVAEQGGLTAATVYYDVTMRQDKRLSATEQVREVWTFVRPTDDPSAMWKLDAIQPLDQSATQ